MPLTFVLGEHDDAINISCRHHHTPPLHSDDYSACRTSVEPHTTYEANNIVVSADKHLTRMMYNS